MSKRIRLLIKSLLFEISIGLLLILLLFNIEIVLSQPMTLDSLLIYNIFRIVLLPIYTLVTFYIGYFIFIISVRNWVFLKFNLNNFGRIVLMVLPYSIMNRWLFMYPSPYTNSFPLKLLGFILLLVGLYLYFKVGLKTEERLRTE